MKNQIIIDHAYQYILITLQKVTILEKINRVRLAKKIILPFELVNIDDR